MCLMLRGARDVLDGRDRVDLVLSDVILPGGTSGPQFADQMKERRPGLKFIFMSGYSPEAAMGAGFLTSGNTLLKKPFQRQQLAAAVREGFDVKSPHLPNRPGQVSRLNYYHGPRTGFCYSIRSPISTFRATASKR